MRRWRKIPMPWVACTQRLTSRTVLDPGRFNEQRLSSEKAFTTCTTQSPSSAAILLLTQVLHRQNPSDLDSSQHSFRLHYTASYDSNCFIMLVIQVH